ncbi:MAG TPA: universal stress protein [Thermoplasmata archaeon]|nr:universal stress protein [Thermoplasmata archaeon]
MFDHILVPYDGSANSDHALSLAIELARRFESSLELVSVAPLVVPLAGSPMAPPLSEEEARMFREVLARGRLKAEKAGLSHVATTFREGNVVEELLNHVDRVKPDLVVVGARGLSRFQRLLMGSVSSALVSHLKVPVLVDHLGPR